MEMAQNLQLMVAQFKLNLETRSKSIVMIEQVKASHIGWLKRATKMLSGEERIPLEEVVTYTDCKFGNWYYGPGGKEFGNNRFFKEMVQVFDRDKHHAQQLYMQLKLYNLKIVTSITNLQSET